MIDLKKIYDCCKQCDDCYDCSFQDKDEYCLISEFRHEEQFKKIEKIYNDLEFEESSDGIDLTKIYDYCDSSESYKECIFKSKRYCEIQNIKLSEMSKYKFKQIEKEYKKIFGEVNNDSF